MRITLPNHLPYPITIQAVKKRVGAEVKLKDTLCTYTYVEKYTRSDRYTDEEIEYQKTVSGTLLSTLEGTVATWLVWEKDVLREAKDVVDISEDCTHPEQFGGLCTRCGRDMSLLKSNQGAGTDRANIQAAHDTTELLITQEGAAEVDQGDKRRLLQARKLSLVVDLDQTIIHATVEPTIGEWMHQPDNPNYEALKDIKYFELVDGWPRPKACTYYIKMRPGLERFLDVISEKYELHIYTMGTRQYAMQVARAVDPEKKYFGDRILSRDESGSMAVKNLTRLFPVDTRMVVIIDDRADVWRWSQNLMRVSAFDFFVGIGDINAGFLPKKLDITFTVQPQANTDDPAVENTNHLPGPDEGRKQGETITTDNEAKDSTSAIDGSSTSDQVLNTADDGDNVAAEIREKQQDETIAALVEEKPLLKAQQIQDAIDGVDTPLENVLGNNTQSTESDSDSSTSSKMRRHAVLNNDDEELVYLEKSLIAVHEKFFSEYDRKRGAADTSPRMSRVTKLAGKSKVVVPSSAQSDDGTGGNDFKDVPDVKRIMPNLKARVLESVIIVFSGILPLGMNIQTADISLWAKSFGAQITDKVGRHVTHVIAARGSTTKVKAAVKRGIPVVTIQWLFKSVQQWKKLDVRKFLLQGIGQRVTDKDAPTESEAIIQAEEVSATIPAPPPAAGLGGEFILSESESGDSELDTDSSNRDKPNGKQPKKKIKLSTDQDTINMSIYPPEHVEEATPTMDANEWKDMDDELRDFMGSDMDSESDADSIRSSRLSSNNDIDKDRGQPPRKKRRRDHDDEAGRSESEMQEQDQKVDTHLPASHGVNKMQKNNKGSALRAVSNTKSEDGSHTPDPGGDQDERDTKTTIPSTQVRQENARLNSMSQDDYDAELAAEIEAALEAEAAGGG